MSGPASPGAAPIPAAEAAGHEPRKRTQQFRRAGNTVRLTPDQRRRQATVMQLGWSLLDGREAMMAFFNAHSPELGGRPLDIAVDSDEGLQRVEAVLRR